MPGYFLRGVLHALNAFLQVGRVLIAGENGDDAFAAHDFGQFIHHLLAAFDVVNAEGDEAFAGRRIGIERGDRHAVLHGGIDGIGQFVGVGATHRDAIGAREDELFDGFGLLLGVLLVGRAPVDFDGDAVFGAQIFGGLFRADARGLKDRVALGFGDQADGVGFFGEAAGAHTGQMSGITCRPKRR